MDRYSPPLNPLEYNQAMERFPRANYWVGAPGHVYHPNIHPQQFQQQVREAAEAADVYRAAQPQHGNGRIPARQYYRPHVYDAGPYAPPLGPPPYHDAIQQAPRRRAQLPADGQQNNRDWRRRSGVITRDIFEVPLDISHADFWDRLCANFDIPPGEAQLGYKFHDDKRRTPWHALGTPEQTATAFQRGAALHLARRIPRDIVMEVHNLNPPPALPQGRAPRGAKHPHGDSENDPDLSTTVSADGILAILKERTFCSTHKKWCWLNPFTGEHVTIDIYGLTLWARKILTGDATIARPPNTLNFDHVRKRARHSSSNNAPPPIHVNIHNHGMPLTDFGGQQMVNTCSSFAPTSDRSVISATLEDFPSVLEDLPSSSRSMRGNVVTLQTVLEDLNDALPHANLLTFIEPLTAAGITLAEDLAGVGDNLLTDVAGIPDDVINVIRDHAKYLTASF
ncbi:hypothetical protein HWV62_26977 [Athelia sp. TMB]|nr:hypothetical protein HWV62_26977 [Athelia sp. TMB]